MRDLVVLFIHFIATLARLLRPGSARSIVAESLLLKHQLLILNRSRQRAPNLSASDRILAGWLALWLRPTRLLRSAIVLKPSTLLGLHQAMCSKNTACCSHPITIASPARRDRVQNSSMRSSK
jgi:putative transposase